MSSASDLLESSQTKFVSDPNLGTSKLVEYRYRVSGEIQEVRAFIEETKEYDQNDKRYYQIIKFHSVILVNPPEEYDVILYNGEEYIVDKWGRNDGKYSIDTLTNTSMKTRRRR